MPSISSPLAFCGFPLLHGYLKILMFQIQRFILRGILAIAVILILSVTFGAMVSLTYRGVGLIRTTFRRFPSSGLAQHPCMLDSPLLQM